MDFVQALAGKRAAFVEELELMRHHVVVLGDAGGSAELQQQARIVLRRCHDAEFCSSALATGGDGSGAAASAALREVVVSCENVDVLLSLLRALRRLLSVAFAAEDSDAAQKDCALVETRPSGFFRENAATVQGDAVLQARLVELALRPAGMRGAALVLHRQVGAACVDVLLLTWSAAVKGPAGRPERAQFRARLFELASQLVAGMSSTSDVVFGFKAVELCLTLLQLDRKQSAEYSAAGSSATPSAAEKALAHNLSLAMSGCAHADTIAGMHQCLARWAHLDEQRVRGLARLPLLSLILMDHLLSGRAGAAGILEVLVVRPSERKAVFQLLRCGCVSAPASASPIVRRLSHFSAPEGAEESATLSQELRSLVQAPPSPRVPRAGRPGPSVPKTKPRASATRPGGAGVKHVPSPSSEQVVAVLERSDSSARTLQSLLSLVPTSSN